MFNYASWPRALIGRLPPARATTRRKLRLPLGAAERQGGAARTKLKIKPGSRRARVRQRGLKALNVAWRGGSVGGGGVEKEAGFSVIG